MSKHHPLARCSNASRWLNCPGSLLLSETMPEPPTNPAAVAGIAMHAECDRALYLDALPDPPGRYTIHEAYTASDFADFEDAETMAVYVNYCISLSQLPGCYSNSEFTLSEGEFTPGGTPDFCARYLDPSGQTVLEVVDLKTGRVAVTAEDNDQLGLYAVRLLAGLHAEGGWYIGKPVRVYATIAQFGRLHRAELSEDYLTQLTHRARQALPPTMRFRAGAWCQYCPALTVCPQMRYDLHKVIWAESGKTASQVTPELYATGLHARNWSAAVISAATSAAERGKLQGYRYVQQKGQWSWQDDTAAVREYLTPDQLDLPSVSAAKKLLAGNKVALAAIAECSKQSTYGVIREAKTASVFDD